MAEKKKHLSRREAFDLEEKFSPDVGRPTGAAQASGQWVQSDPTGFANYWENAKQQVFQSLSEMRQIEARVKARAENIARIQGEKSSHSVFHGGGHIYEVVPSDVGWKAVKKYPKGIVIHSAKGKIRVKSKH